MRKAGAVKDMRSSSFFQQNANIIIRNTSFPNLVNLPEDGKI